MTTTTDHASQGEIFDFCTDLLSKRRAKTLQAVADLLAKDLAQSD